MRVVVLGLTLSSSWGNGHAVTYRALLAALFKRGHDILFLERETAWYSAHRDLEAADYCTLRFYRDLADLRKFAGDVAAADAVIVGSYVPEGVAVGAWVQDTAQGVRAFYDIDTPVTLARLGRGDREYLGAEQIPGYDVYLSFTGGPTLGQLERDFASPAARALYCSADSDIYRPLDVPKRWDLSYLGTYSDDRQPVLEKILLEPARRLPHLRFVVAGPQYPKAIVWPANVERIEHLPPAEHPAFYAASRFTLNVTRADMVAVGHSPSIRIFEAGACGTPIISDIWEGLDALLAPGREIILAAGSDEVVAALATPLAAARAIGLAARARILCEHTPAHRAEALERYLREAAGSRAERSRSPHSLSQEVSMRLPKVRMKILVAGGAGFLGSHLCDQLLAEAHEVVCLDSLLTGSMRNLEDAMKRPGFEFVRHDIVDPLPARLSERRFDRIYNLACAASPPQYQADPEHTMMTCVVGVSNLLKFAEQTKARFLFTSTSEVYGDPEVHPQPETYRGSVNSIGPRACYDEGKRAAESLTFDYERHGRAEVRLARIFNTYGPRLSAADGRVISNFVSQALAGRDLTIYGDGTQTRSFCYVKDLVSGLVALMEYEGTQLGPVNLGNPTELSVAKLVTEVLALTGSASRITQLPLPADDPRRRRPDIGKAETLLGWRPTTSLHEGLRRTIDWFAIERNGVRDTTPVAALLPG